MNKETIVAISTPAGVGAVGMVRISGKTAKDVLSKMWVSHNTSVDKFETHRLYYGKIAGLSTDGGGVIDNVLAVWMKEPRSFTGEDVVEVHCHGGSVSAKKILSTALNAGARMAAPGEFTRRAFLNGKMDLAQAEGVAEVINAETDRAYRLASEQLEGRLSSEIKKNMTRLKNIKAFVEATIDFPEEDTEFIKKEGVSEKLGEIVGSLKKLSASYNEGRLIHDGVRVVIVGKPNVGKSSIMNAILGSNRAIVHHAPGTTRDVIEEDVELNGILFRLIDTAGIRDSECEIEKIGIERARLRLAEADVAMVVLDASRLIEEEDKKILDETKNLKRIVVLNKTDQKTHGEAGVKVDVEISAKTGEGMGGFKKKLSSLVVPEEGQGNESVIITNLRHKVAIDETLNHLSMAGVAENKNESAEFVAYHLQNAMNSLGKITGEVTTEDVLNEIFSKFCIGK